MNSDAWLNYFSNNQRADSLVPRTCGEALLPPVRAELASSLARFQLGEASGGRIAQEVETVYDVALDPASRRAIQLYVAEEGRHARELLQLLLALGGKPVDTHWSSDWFRRIRRCLGLRTKLLTMAAAEVVGIAYYGAVRDAVACAVTQRVLGVIAREEKRHLDFQAEWFARAIARAPLLWRPILVGWIALRFGVILFAAVLSVTLDHGRVLRAAGVGPWAYMRACYAEIAARRRFFGSTGSSELPTFPAAYACVAATLANPLQAQSRGPARRAPNTDRPAPMSSGHNSDHSESKEP